MDYTTRPADKSDQAHVNYDCPCGCIAGLFYDKTEGSTHLGECCCGRLLWVGAEAEANLRAGYAPGVEYVLDRGSASLPWGEVVETVLAVPAGQLAAPRAAMPAAAPVVDVVCGMSIDPATAAATSVYRGTTYYFCAAGCKQRFDSNPAHYLPRRGLLSRLLGR